MYACEFGWCGEVRSPLIENIVVSVGIRITYSFLCVCRPKRWTENIHLFEWTINECSFDTMFFFIFFGFVPCRRERWLFFSESWSARTTDRIGHLTFLTRNNEILATTICILAMTSSAHIAKSVASMARFAAGVRFFWCRSLVFHQKLNLWCRSSSLSTCPLCKNYRMLMDHLRVCHHQTGTTPDAATHQLDHNS